MRPKQREHKDVRVPDGLEFVATLIGLVTGIVALVEFQWWISALCLITVGVGVSLWLRGRRISAPGVGIAVVAGIVGTLAINGAVAAWPSRDYTGDFMVVGSTVQVARMAPSTNSPEDRDAVYAEGDTVPIICRERDWQRPSRSWYRLRDADSFLPADALVPSPANPPDRPPYC